MAKRNNPKRAGKADVHHSAEDEDAGEVPSEDAGEAPSDAGDGGGDAEPDQALAEAAPKAPQIGIPRKVLYWIGGITLAVWAFTINTGSTVLLIIVSVLTAVAAFLLWRAFRFVGKQRKMVSLLQGAGTSAEARRDALAKLNESKDAGSPTNIFARAQLMAADDPKAALQLLETLGLKDYPAQLQDDVALLETQLYLSFGRTQDARKTADSMNLDNPERKQIRAFAASIAAEAWARTGRSKDALALLDTVEIPKENAEQIAIQMRVARVFGKFASGQRERARVELVELADVDVNHLSRFLAPQFRVHPELQKLARRVLEAHPSARRQIKAQAQSVKRR